MRAQRFYIVSIASSILILSSSSDSDAIIKGFKADATPRCHDNDNHSRRLHHVQKEKQLYQNRTDFLSERSLVFGHVPFIRTHHRNRHVGFDLPYTFLSWSTPKDQRNSSNLTLEPHPTIETKGLGGKVPPIWPLRSQGKCYQYLAATRPWPPPNSMFVNASSLPPSLKDLKHSQWISEYSARHQEYTHNSTESNNLLSEMHCVTVLIIKPILQRLACDFFSAGSRSRWLGRKANAERTAGK